MKKQIPAWLVLAIIMIVAAAAMAGTNMMTKDVIAGQAAVDAENARKEVLAAADFFEQLPLDESAKVDSLYVGKKDGTDVGYVSAIIVKGYGGDIEVIAGVLEDGTIAGVNVGGSSFAETAGLGAKAKDPAFVSQFSGKIAPLKVVKAGEAKTDATIDAITAATITSSAVTRGVNDIAKHIDAMLNPVDVAGGVFTPGTATASADGFGGPVAVTVTFGENAAITAISIGDDQFKETPGYGAAALEPEFAAQFMGKTAPIAMADVDAISGATITSEAVLSAINAAYQQLSVPAFAFEAGTATASAEGFAGPVAVTVTFDENATITGITVGDDQFAETPGYGAGALEPAFAEQFVGISAPVAMADVDAISGATITSEAVLDAINSAYKQRMMNAASEPEAAPEPEEAPEEPVADSVEAPRGAEEIEGGITVSKEGFAGPVAVTVLFADDNATIEKISIGDDKFAETEGFGAAALEPAFAEQFIGKKAPLTADDFDVISGATYTNDAVLAAINEAQAQAAAPREEPVQEITVSKEGFAGPVAVTVLFADDKATIEKITIGDNKFAETEGFGAAALEPAFAEQFVGKKAPLTADDFDGISGATYTNDAVLAAINEAQAQAAGDEQDDAASEVPAVEAPVVEPVVAEENKAGITVSKDGFAGPVAVTVLFDDDNATIERITIGDDKFAETEGFGAAALEPVFAEQFVGKKVPLTADDFDGISGATYTNDAVLAAINEAQAQAAGDEQDDAASVVPAVEAPVVEPVVAEENKAGITVSKEGFAGPVAVTVLFADDNATIEKISIGDDKFAETEGFGAAALEPAFAEQFIGKKAPLTADDFDVISGATYTNDAVLAAINEAQAQAAAPREEPVQEITVSKEGFAGPVAVTVLFADDKATIEKITIGDDKFAETEGFGAAALEPAFAEQFVGKKAPLTADDFDGISGATYTNDAVLAAINEAQAQAAGDEQDDAASEVPAVEAPVVEPVVAEENKAGITVSKDGFAGPVAVTVLFDDDNATIERITIGDDKFAETEGFGAAALEPAFAEQFVGKKVPLTADDFDGISGATYTNDAVLAAINEAQAQAAGDEQDDAASVVPAVEAPVVEPVVAEENKAGITVSKEGFAGPVAVTVLFADDNATIERITIGDDKFAETEGFGAAALEPAFAEQFIGKKVPLTADDFDVISGATYTNDAVLAGINEAQTQAAAPREEPVQEITVSKEGFAGPVAVTVLFADDNATIEEITIGDDKFAETEGFGAAALEPAFAEQFVGKKAPLTADDFDGISGATYTNDAVLAAINEAQAQAAAPREEPVQEITVSKEGFAGPVAVTVLFADDKATIEKITIGDDKFAETEGFGAAALEPAFAEQFIGKKAPLTADDFDVISGATYTNDAVLAAINEAQAQAAAPREEPVQEITVSKEGFAGPVAVTVLFADDKATIEKITIGDDKFAETEGFGAAALEPAFAEQFVGKKAPLTADDFDVISGATYTNDAILEAINEAWESQNK